MFLRDFQPLDARAQLVARPEFQGAFADGNGDVVGVEGGNGGKQDFPVFVLFADTDGGIGHAVENFPHLSLDQGTLFLDNDHHIEPAGKGAQALRFQRPGAADFVNRQSDLGGAGFVDAESVERLANIEIGLAGGDNPELWHWSTANDDAVQPVGLNEGQSCG